MRKLTFFVLVLLLLTTMGSQAAQRSLALVPPDLNYQEKAAHQHPAAMAMVPVYEALRSGISDHARQLLPQNHVLLVRESSTPHPSNQDNISRFYAMSEQDRQAWLQASSLDALAWLELDEDFKNKLGRCQGAACKVGFSFNLHLASGVLVQTSNEFRLRDQANTLGRDELLAIVSHVNAAMNTLWNTCVAATDERLAGLCAEDSKVLEGFPELDLTLVAITAEPESED